MIRLHNGTNSTLPIYSVSFLYSANNNKEYFDYKDVSKQQPVIGIDNIYLTLKKSEVSNHSFPDTIGNIISIQLCLKNSTLYGQSRILFDTLIDSINFDKSFNIMEYTLSYSDISEESMCLLNALFIKYRT
jgi:hypothetical protein